MAKKFWIFCIAVNVFMTVWSVALWVADVPAEPIGLLPYRLEQALYFVTAAALAMAILDKENSRG